MKNLFVANYTLTPTFDPNVNDYSIIISGNTDSVFINAEAYDKKAAVGGIGNILTQTSYTQAIIYCVAENMDIRQYNITIYKPGAENVQAINNNENVTPIIVPSNTISNTAISNTSSNNNIELYGPGGQLNNVQGVNVQVGVAPGQ